MLKEQVKVDYVGAITYFGKAKAGALISDPYWSVTKIEHDAMGKVINITHSGGVHDQIFIWYDRENLEYK